MCARACVCVRVRVCVSVQVSTAVALCCKVQSYCSGVKAHLSTHRGGWQQRKGWRCRVEQSGEQVPLEDLFNRHTSPSFALSLSLSAALSLSIWIMLSFKNLIYSIHWFCLQELASTGPRFLVLADGRAAAVKHSIWRGFRYTAISPDRPRVDFRIWSGGVLSQ